MSFSKTLGAQVHGAGISATVKQHGNELGNELQIERKLCVHKKNPCNVPFCVRSALSAASYRNARTRKIHSCWHIVLARSRAVARKSGAPFRSVEFKTNLVSMSLVSSVYSGD